MLLEPRPVGWPLPAFSSKPDSWAFWPKLAPLQQSLGSASKPAGFKAKVHPVPACSILSGTGSGQHADEVVKMDKLVGNIAEPFASTSSSLYESG